jgi:hypothetical protein
VGDGVAERQMGRLEAFSIPDCSCWFHTGDHGPHHFHAGVVDGWEVRIFFMQEPVGYEVKFAVRRIPARAPRRLLAKASQHRPELLREWDRHAADE